MLVTRWLHLANVGIPIGSCGIDRVCGAGDLNAALVSKDPPQPVGDSVVDQQSFAPLNCVLLNYIL
jgi:hypothetical protein